MTILIFLSSGLFLGWSLGANDAANVFGTAVSSKMVRFKTAAIVSGIFVILGATLSGAGASGTLGKLGSINEIAGAFIVAFSAAITVYWMTKLKLPVSTSQAIVGSIIAWNFFSNFLTDYNSFRKILLTWVLCPVMSAGFSMVLYKIMKVFMAKKPVHLLKQDKYTRSGLILVGAFGAYSLGANNIANVVGVFVPVIPFDTLEFGLFDFTGVEQLFLLGGIAITVGIVTYSRRVMETVGNSIFKLNPEGAFIVVLSSSLVLFLFASQGLEKFLMSYGLPTLPLVPVSSSQAVVGAVIGIGIMHGGKGINYRVLGNIASGWVITPIVAAIISLISLFVFQNVFNQKVYTPVHYEITSSVLKKIKKEEIKTTKDLQMKRYDNAVEFKKATIGSLESEKDFMRLLKLSKISPLVKE